MNWQFHEILDPLDKFHAFWNQEESHVTMEIQVATLGWVGIGFSPNGDMKGADIFLAWVKDGQIVAHDRHATERSTTLIDSRQDYSLLGGEENGTHTIIRFSRNWNTCDENPDEDFMIEEETIRLIWAYNDNDPIDEAYPEKHKDENRGAKAVVLRGPAEREFVSTPDMGTWDVFRNNYEIPSDTDTTYLCEIIKIPDFMLEQKHHVVAVSA